MIDFSVFDKRPLLIALAGSNGAGKSTFYSSFLKRTALPFINADILAKQHDLQPYDSAKAADVLRRHYVLKSESFVFETVFSDPVGDKIQFLQQASAAGFHVVVCFIAIRTAGISEQRVAMRVSQGGHDVPKDKIESRFPRTIANLMRAIELLPDVLIFDNTNLADPYRLVARYQQGLLMTQPETIPEWLDVPTP